MKYLSVILMLYFLHAGMYGQDGEGYDELIQAGENRIAERDYYGAIDEFNRAGL